MEVRNNPSFGMAFIKPQAADMSGFTKLVTTGRRPGFVARGLKQLQAEHAADRFVNIHYLPDAKGFSVIPKDDLVANRKLVESVLGGTSHAFYPDTVMPTRLSKVGKEFDARIDELSKSKAPKIKTAFVTIKGLFKMLKETARVAFFSPKDTLPASLRAASAEAKRVEKGVTEELARRAAKEKIRIANEKLIDNALK